MKSLTKISAVGMGMAPFLAFAEGAAADLGWVTNLVTDIGEIITSLIPILIALALLVFVWGVVKFISASDDSARDDGKKKMIWGVVGLFVIVSVWGLVALLQQLIGVEDLTETTTLPTVTLDGAAAI